jgi:hypothetical protein
MLFSTLALGLAASSDVVLGAQDTQTSAKPWMDDRLAAHLQQVLGCRDDEWQALSQKMEPVLMLMYQRARFGRMRLPKPARDGQTRDASAGGNIIAIKNDPGRVADRGTPNAEMAEYYFQLISLASQQAPYTGELKVTLNEYRAARAKSDAEFTQARSALRELVTFKQEAVLVVMGILD